MRIVFAGTPLLAAKQLEALCQTQHDLIAVYTQPDRPKGRGLKEVSSPVKSLAIEKNIPVEQPINFKNQRDIETLQAYEPDLLVVAAYGLLLPDSVLNCPKYGCVNIHFSLLPRWRGAAPIQYAILSGDQQTGVTLMQMDQGLDTGDILVQESCDILPTDTTASLQEKLCLLGQNLLKNKLNEPLFDKASVPQKSDLATHAPKIKKQQALIDFTSQDAVYIDRAIRAFTPWPGPFFIFKDQTLRIHEAILLSDTDEHPPGKVIEVTPEGLTLACKKGTIQLKKLQFPGKKPLPFEEIIKSKRDFFDVEQA